MHFIRKCKVCGDVIGQCRCPDLNKKVEYGLCLKCSEKRSMNYVQNVQALLDEELKMKGADYEGLLEVYTLLVITKGENCTNEDVHDAWSIWQNKTQPSHRSLIPFEQLTKKVQDLDDQYRLAIIKVSKFIK